MECILEAVVNRKSQMLASIDMMIAVENIEIVVDDGLNVCHNRNWGMGNAQQCVLGLNLVAVPYPLIWRALIIRDTDGVAGLDAITALIQKVVFAKLGGIHVQPRCKRGKRFGSVGRGAPKLVEVGGVTHWNRSRVRVRN
jgi:hypothetical protein